MGDYLFEPMICRPGSVNFKNFTNKIFFSQSVGVDLCDVSEGASVRDGECNRLASAFKPNAAWILRLRKPRMVLKTRCFLVIKFPRSGSPCIELDSAEIKATAESKASAQIYRENIDLQYGWKPT